MTIDKKEQAGATEGMVREISHMLWEWQASDELSGEFARRLIDYFRDTVLSAPNIKVTDAGVEIVVKND